MKRLNELTLSEIIGGNIFKDIGYIIGYVWYHGTHNYDPSKDTSK